MRRDLVIGLSLSTLWFIGIWSDLLPFLYISDNFPIGALPCWNDFAAVVFNVVLLAVAFAACAQMARRGPRPAFVLAQWALLGSLALPANALRNHFNTPPERLYALLGPIWGLAVFGAVAVLLLGVAIRWRSRVVGAVTAILVIMFPLVLITFAQAAWALSQAGGPMRCGGGEGRADILTGKAARRVLWIVYDEFDYLTPFANRAPGVVLPQLDRLRAESFSASSAVPPGDRTQRSMPSFLTGLRVTESSLKGRNQLQLKIEGRQEFLTWSAESTIFPRARALGLNTGLAGFFLPYCAILGDTLTTCTWQPCVTCGRLTGVFGNSVGESMWHQASELVPGYSRRRHLAAYRALQDAGRRLAADPAIGFALIHLPVPHEPGIYDPAQGDFSMSALAGDGYVHNLALVDRSLGELREALARSGLWDRTTVMVFGDHGRRSLLDNETIADPRVPFIVKLAGQSEAVSYTAPVEVLHVHDLTLEILAGRITTVDELTTWLSGPT